MLLLLHVSPPVVFGQALLFKNYTTRDGLPDSRVAPIFQDREGYIWFGTQAGLTRYDGNEFVNSGPANEIPGIFGRSIMQDHTGAIWFAHSGFHEGGITRFAQGSTTLFNTTNGLHGRQAYLMVEDARGDIWAGTDFGLEHIQFTDSSRSRWTVEARPDSAMMAIYADRNGRIFYACGRGLFDLPDGSPHPIWIAPKRKRGWHIRPYSFYEARDGTLCLDA